MLRRTFVAALFARREAEQVDLWRQGDGGVHTYRIPALAEPCHAEALALLAGLGGKDAALVRAGIIGRLGREDDASGGDLLLALGASSAE